MTEQAGGRRAGLIEAAQTRWIAALTDLGGRNTLRGISVVPQYGVGGYRVDFAATHPQDPGRMVLAIEADGASYRQSGSVRDRDRLRGEHLQRLGWSFHRLWSTNWFADPHAEVAKVRDATGAPSTPPSLRCPMSRSLPFRLLVRVWISSGLRPPRT